MINRAARRVAAAAEDDEDDDPWGTKEPVPVAKKPSVRTGGPSAAPSSRRSGKLEPRRRAAPKPAAPPKPPAADDGWGDDAWGDDVPAKPVALKSSPKKTGGKTLPKKGGTLSLSKGAFSKDQKAAPPPKAKTEEQIKAGKAQGGGGRRTRRPRRSRSCRRTDPCGGDAPPRLVWTAPFLLFGAGAICGSRRPLGSPLGEPMPSPLGAVATFGSTAAAIMQDQRTSSPRLMSGVKTIRVRQRNCRRDSLPTRSNPTSPKITLTLTGAGRA